MGSQPPPGATAGAAAGDEATTRRKLSQGERHEAITELVLGNGAARIEDLSDEFGVSTMTIHRDLDSLAAQGVLRKARGVASADANSLFEASSRLRARKHREEKESVAHCAFSMVEPGQAIILDDSTTGLFLAEQLPQKQPLTVITNYQGVLNALSGHPGVLLLALGGQYYPWCDSYMGNITIDALRGLRADIVFMSTSAISDDICFHQHHDTVLVKRAMLKAARRRVLYVDHSKFNQRALHALAPLTDFDTVILGHETSGDDVTRLEQAGVSLVMAPPLPRAAVHLPH